MSDGVNDKSPTPFVQFMLTAVPAGIVVVAGWMFGNIFAELQHQRQRQENLVREVTAINTNLISLTQRFDDVRTFYREQLVEHQTRLNDLEKELQRLDTKLVLSNDRLGLPELK